MDEPRKAELKVDGEMIPKEELESARRHALIDAKSRK